MLYKKVKESFQQCQQYAKSNVFALLCGVIVFVCCFAPYLGSQRIGLDTFHYVRNGTFLYNWMDIGRWGAVLLKKIFDSQFCLYYAAAVAAIVYLGVLFYMCRLWDNVGGISCGYSVLAFLLTFISPIYAEQYYFTNQMIEIALGFLILFMSLHLSWSYVKSSKMVYAVGAVILIALNIGVYQSFCMLYIAGVCFQILISYKKEFEQGKTAPAHGQKTKLNLLVKEISLFLIGYVVYMIVVKLSGAQSTYLSGQIAWRTAPFLTCVMNILLHVKSVVLGKGLYYSVLYVVLVLLVSYIIFIDIIKEKFTEKYIYVLSGIGLIASPFLLTVYMGVTPVLRAQIALPFVIGCMLCFVLQNMCGLKKIILIALSGYILLSQINTFSRLQYTQDFIFEKDKTLAIDVYQEIWKMAEGENKEIRIAVVGTAENSRNSNCLFEDGVQELKESVLNFGAQILPHYFWSTDNTVGFLTALGYPCSHVSSEELIDARKEAIHMPIYPSEGYIREYNGYYIVKLSEDLFADELSGY
ncbi:glucosyltransferase domain-containing protein [Frisingicoccus sp.]|uniref:glucosyltransferase domain-containing protein n=1 Tax=Frisingicoccus sp. TaxID=1918627 RepID=UPI003AB7FCAC